MFRRLFSTARQTQPVGNNPGARAAVPPADDHFRTLKRQLLIGGGLAAGFALSLYLAQDWLIYRKREYDDLSWGVDYRVHRAHFDQTLADSERPHLEELSYELEGEGRQVAFLVPPICPEPTATANGTVPEVTLWVLQGGNAALALDWLWFLSSALKWNARQLQTTGQEGIPGLNATGFLLVDYPGYGSSKGTPNPHTCLQSALLATRLGVERASRGGNSTAPCKVRLNFLGHSIGAAASLQAAVALLLRSKMPQEGAEHIARHAAAQLQESTGRGSAEEEAETVLRRAAMVSPETECRLDKLVLVSPFTSLLQLAGGMFWFFPRPLFSLLLKHKWDNTLQLRMLEEALESPAVRTLVLRKDILASGAPPQDAPQPPLQLHILHGSSDEIVPVTMGRELARQAEAMAGRLKAALQREALAVQYQEFGGMDHNNILGANMKDILKCMFW